MDTLDFPAKNSLLNGLSSYINNLVLLKLHLKQVTKRYTLKITFIL
jgi:hypothetical protein